MSPFARRLTPVVAVTILVGAAVLYFTVRKEKRAHARPVPKADLRGIDASGRTPVENRDIADALAALPNDGKVLRVAGDGDATPSDGHRDLDNLYVDYHPFFTRGDLDGDGRLDFVQAFMEKGSAGPWFHVAAFFGRPDGTFETIWVEKSVSLAAGDVSIERSLLIVTPDLDLDQVRRWRFEPQERRFVDADEESSSDTLDEDAPEAAPDGRPQVRA